MYYQQNEDKGKFGKFSFTFILSIFISQSNLFIYLFLPLSVFISYSLFLYNSFSQYISLSMFKTTYLSILLNISSYFFFFSLNISFWLNLYPICVSCNFECSSYFGHSSLLLQFHYCTKDQSKLQMCILTIYIFFSKLAQSYQRPKIFMQNCSFIKIEAK